jgi:hypothetical protein
MANLIVNFKNMCVFAQGENRTEAWFPENAFHEPFLVVDGLAIPDGLKHEIQDLTSPPRKGLPLKGRILSFLDGGTPLPNGATELVGQHTDVLPHLDKLLPEDLALDSSLNGMSEIGLPDLLFSKVVIRGGTLKPLPLNSPGGLKTWQMSDLVSTRFSQDAIYSVPVTSATVTLRISPVAAGTPIDVTIPQVSTDFPVSVSSENLDQTTMMETKQGVVFLTEFNLFQPLVADQKLRAPFTFWPNFAQETDPNGGPCMMVRLNLTE